MITWDAIEQANSGMNLIPFERKDRDTGEIKVTMYAPVNERVKAFRKTMPTGRITTQILQNDEKIIVVQAFVYGTDGELLATGHAFERKDGSYISKTSWLEVCETSAVGRALGFCGYGVDAAISSADELTGAQMEQQRIKEDEIRKMPIGITRAETLKQELENKGVSVEKILEKCRVAQLEDITEEQHREIIVWLNKKKK